MPRRELDYELPAHRISYILSLAANRLVVSEKGVTKSILWVFYCNDQPPIGTRFNDRLTYQEFKWITSPVSRLRWAAAAIRVASKPS